MTRDEVLFWLHDHKGGDVTLEARIDKHSTTVLSAEGTLRFWRDDPPERAASVDALAGSDDDYIGVFVLDTSDNVILDFTGLEALTGSKLDEDTIEVALADGVSLLIACH